MKLFPVIILRPCVLFDDESFQERKEQIRNEGPHSSQIEKEKFSIQLGAWAYITFLFLDGPMQVFLSEWKSNQAS